MERFQSFTCPGKLLGRRGLRLLHFLMSSRELYPHTNEHFVNHVNFKNRLMWCTTDVSASALEKSKNLRYLTHESIPIVS